MRAVWLWAAAAAAAVCCARATELTFDMDPHSSQCFYQPARQGQTLFLDYQVVYGGRLDIDVEIKVNDRPIWSIQRSQTHEHTFTAQQEGEYEFCFSNSFSTVAHKTVYVDIQVDHSDDPPIESGAPHEQALTRIETALVNMHDSLRKVDYVQTHLRLRESTHRLTAEFINQRVQVVSALEALLLICVSIFQVYYLQSLFSDRPNRF